MTFVESGRSFDLVPGSSSDVSAFGASVNQARRFYVTLASAEIAFATGRADYVNAVENLTHLFSAKDESERRSIETMKDADAFFNPPEVSSQFKNGEDFARFIGEALPRLERSDG